MSKNHPGKKAALIALRDSEMERGRILSHHREAVNEVRVVSREEEGVIISLDWSDIKSALATLGI